ncbi:hypothetical protein PRIPAC_89511 [Pristionchus pacificus]|uniref:Probable deoxycytidylate deaminase n=1 Tax=Pristionchus pacificus TaxID=54126 RepID=A0A2A6CVH7_PRIPA|nr:hypothetical protein PRIPAC_89511 [Pristionchus pacificus]|eukprot:PDM82232.1 hypothetical protein PRIPAC_36625 [Pristionchus pacificus]
MVESTPPHCLQSQRNVIQKKDMLISACGDSIVIQKGSDAEKRKKRQIFPEPIRFLLSIGDEKAIFFAMSSNKIALFQMKKNMPIVMFNVDDGIIGHGEVKVKKNEENGREFKLTLIIPLTFRSGTLRKMRLTVHILDSKIVKQKLKCVEEMRMENEDLKMCVSLGSNALFGVYEDTVVKSDGFVTRVGEPSLKKKRRIAVAGRDLWLGNMIMATENGSIRVVQVKDDEENENDSLRILSKGECVPPFCAVRCRQPTIIISTENTVFVGTQRGEVHCLNEQLECIHKYEMEGGPINCLKVDENDVGFLWIGFDSGEMRRMEYLNDISGGSECDEDGISNNPNKKTKIVVRRAKLSETELECLEKGCYYKTLSSRAFEMHLRRTHRTTFVLAGLVLRCQCGFNAISWYHSQQCNAPNLRVIRKHDFGPIRTLADKKVTPQCISCEVYPTTVYGYANHLYMAHHTFLDKIPYFLRCGVCKGEFYTRHECLMHSKKCKSRFYKLLLVGEVEEEKNETEMDQMVESTLPHPLPLQRCVIQKKDMLISACGDSIVIQKGSDAEKRKKRQIFPEPIRFLLSIGNEKAIFFAMSSNKIALFLMKKNMPIVMFNVDDGIIGHGEVKVKKNEENGREFKLTLIIPLTFRSGTLRKMRLTVHILDTKIVKQRLKCMEEMRMEGEEMKMDVVMRDEDAPPHPPVMNIPVKDHVKTIMAKYLLSFVMTSPSNGCSTQSDAAREGYLEWDEYFMGIAILTGQRSKDPNTQVGCVLVDARYRVVAAGYNGMPWGCADSAMPWGRNGDEPMEDKNTYVCHAEMNAVMNKNCVDLEGCRLYTTLFPCNECAKIVVQSRVKEVIYLTDRESWKMDAAKRLFDTVGITYSQFKPKRDTVTIDYTKHF